MPVVVDIAPGSADNSVGTETLQGLKINGKQHQSERVRVRALENS